MLAHLATGSTPTLVLLGLCFVLVLAFEFSNGFHDTANAVATVIYTHALKPVQAVVWSGICNFFGVVLGGIAVAYALVEILPPEVLSPPDGGTAIGMLIALFVTALGWNVATWLLAIPNSSSHALIGSLVGIALGSSLRNRHLGQGVEWRAIFDVLEGLAVLAAARLRARTGPLFSSASASCTTRRLFTPPEEGQGAGLVDAGTAHRHLHRRIRRARDQRRAEKHRPHHAHRHRPAAGSLRPQSRRAARRTAVSSARRCRR